MSFCLAFLRSWERTYREGVQNPDIDYLRTWQSSTTNQWTQTNLDALPSRKKKRDWDTCDTGHFHIIVNEHKLVQKPLRKISILQSRREKMLIEFYHLHKMGLEHSSFQVMHSASILNKHSKNLCYYKRPAQAFGDRIQLTEEIFKNDFCFSKIEIRFSYFP